MRHQDRLRPKGTDYHIRTKKKNRYIIDSGVDRYQDLDHGLFGYCFSELAVLQVVEMESE
jgi:hypothetical protein